MKPLFSSKHIKNDVPLKRSNVVYVTLCSSFVGFMLLFVCLFGCDRVGIGTALFILSLPFIASVLFGLVVGLLHGVLYAIKYFIDSMVFFYLGYDYYKLKQKLDKQV